MQIQFTEAQVEKLRLESSERGVSIAAVVRDAVDARPMVVGDERWNRMLASFGQSGGSGRSDISVNHDTYLADAYGADDEGQ